MNNPFTKDSEHSFALLLQANESSFKLGNQLGTWLIVGNAGALVITLQAITQRGACGSQPLLVHAAFNFTLGTIIAFAAGAFTYLTWIGTVTWMSYRVRSHTLLAWLHDHGQELASRGEALEEGSDLDLIGKKSMGLIQNPWGAIIISVASAVTTAIYVTSGVYFALGVMGPLNGISELARPCGADAAVAPTSAHQHSPENLPGTAAVKLIVKLPTSK